MALKFKATVDQPAWLKMIRERQRPVATAAVAALRETAFNSVQEGRRNIAGAGKFGPKWQEGLQFRTVDAQEVARLAQSFNRMTTSLAKAMQLLRARK